MDFRSSRDSFGSRVALRPCSPLLSDAGTLQRAHSHVGFGVSSKFAKTLPEFGSKVCFPSASLRERAPAAVLWQNSRAESRAAELDRVLTDLALQAAPGVKTGAELDATDVLETGTREEQFHKDPARTWLQKFRSFQSY